MNGRHIRAALAGVIVLAIASMASLVPTPAQAAVSVDTLRARAIYQQTKGDQESLRYTMQALESASPIEGQIWNRLIPAWDDAYANLRINATPPSGLPDHGHAFALLGLALNEDGTMKADLVSRLEVAKASLDAYPNSKIVVSGGVARNGWTEATRMRDWLQSKGIDAGRIILENQARNTQENGLRSLELMYAEGTITSYTVISSASHIRRAWIDYYAASLKTAKDLGVDAIIDPRSNVAFMDNATSENYPSASEQSLTSSNIASLFGVSSLYSSLSTSPPPRPVLTVSAPSAPAGSTVAIKATFTNGDLLKADDTQFQLHAPDGYTIRATDAPSTVVNEKESTTQTWAVEIPAHAPPATTVSFAASVHWTVNDERATNELHTTASILISSNISDPYRTAATTDSMSFAESDGSFVINGGGRDAYARADEYGAIFRSESLASGHAVATIVSEQSPTSPYARAGLIVRNDLNSALSSGYATLGVTPNHGCVFAWDSDANGTLDKNVESGGFNAPVQLRINRIANTFTGSCSGDGKNWVDVGSATLATADTAVDSGVYFSAVNDQTKKTGLARFTTPMVSAYARPSTAASKVVSVGKPTTAFSSETERGPSFIVDGARTNTSYWASSLTEGPTWAVIDLGSLHDITSLNVRNYVAGGRSYTYRLLGSNDQVSWFPLGGKSWVSAATDTGENFVVQARARYIRVDGLSNTANPSFHVSELTVVGAESVVPK